MAGLWQRIGRVFLNVWFGLMPFWGVGLHVAALSRPVYTAGWSASLGTYIYVGIMSLLTVGAFVSLGWAWSEINARYEDPKAIVFCLLLLVSWPVGCPLLWFTRRKTGLHLSMPALLSHGALPRRTKRVIRWSLLAHNVLIITAFAALSFRVVLASAEVEVSATVRTALSTGCKVLFLCDGISLLVLTCHVAQHLSSQLAVLS